MDEHTPEIGPEVKKTRKYRPRKPYVGIEIRLGRKKYRGAQFQITDRFLIVNDPPKSTYLSLEGIGSFEIVDTRPSATIPIMSDPTYVVPEVDSKLMARFNASRNREIESAMDMSQFG